MIRKKVQSSLRRSSNPFIIKIPQMVTGSISTYRKNLNIAWILSVFPVGHIGVYDCIL